MLPCLWRIEAISPLTSSKSWLRRRLETGEAMASWARRSLSKGISENKGAPRLLAPLSLEMPVEGEERPTGGGAAANRRGEEAPFLRTFPAVAARGGPLGPDGVVLLRLALLARFCGSLIEPPVVGGGPLNLLDATWLLWLAAPTWPPGLGEGLPSRGITPLGELSEPPRVP